MLKNFMAIMLIQILFAQCGSHTISTDIQQKAFELSDHKSKSWITLCGVAGFTESAAEHIINEIEEPFFVQEIKGNIINDVGDGWSKESRVLFEVRRTSGGPVRRTFADECGSFVMKHIPDGQYCFKATVLGWQSVMGIIVVNKRGGQKSAIVLNMHLGV